MENIFSLDSNGASSQIKFSKTSKDISSCGYTESGSPLLQDNHSLVTFAVPCLLTEFLHCLNMFKATKVNFIFKQACHIMNANVRLIY